MAFRNVFSEPFDNRSNGLFTGKFLEPFRTECSRIWGVPASDSGIVLNAMLNVLFGSSAKIFKTRALLLICSKSPQTALISVTCFFMMMRNPLCKIFVFKLDGSDIIGIKIKVKEKERSPGFFSIMSGFKNFVCRLGDESAEKLPIRLRKTLGKFVITGRYTIDAFGEFNRYYIGKGARLLQ